MILPYVTKSSCKHGIIISLWLICSIRCRFSISYISISGIAAHDRCNISQVFTFFSISMSNVLLFFSFVLFVCCFCFLFFVSFMPQAKNQQSHSLYLVLTYFIFVTTIFRFIVFKFYDFVILL